MLYRNRCFYNVFYTYDELYHEDFTSATWEICYPCWTFTVKLHNCGCSYCVATGCSQDCKEAQQQQQYVLTFIYLRPAFLFSCTTVVWQFAINEYVMLCYVTSQVELAISDRVGVLSRLLYQFYRQLHHPDSQIRPSHLLLGLSSFSDANKRNY